MRSVYMINGFLESGKSEFIRYTLEQPYFRIREKTLLILCEEGEVEFESRLLRESRTVLEVIEEKEDFTPEYLTALDRKHKPERVIIEYNGMWNYKELKLPANWRIEQQITTIDASTFAMYYTNMRSLLAEMLRASELIIFNRCDGIEDLSNYKRNVKAINQKAEIIFEDANGEIDMTLEEELPYDMKKDVLELDDTGYGVWYLDALEHAQRYEGKKMVFIGRVLKPKTFPKDYFVPGRMAMTCCADDMTFLGFACEYGGAAKLKEYDWVKVTASLSWEYWADYEGEGPILHALSVEPAKAPKKEVIDFS